MGLTGLVAFSGGAGFEPLSTILVGVALITALFRHPGPETALKLDRIWLPLATLLVVRALVHVFVIRDDVVIPVVHLLFLLMAVEALRPLDAVNDIRLYALSFALVLASTAYRPGVLFLVAFIGYVGVGTMALMVGHVRRAAEAHGVREVALGRRLVGTTLALSVVTLTVAGALFLALPRVSRGFAGRGETAATSIVGFSDEVSIGQHGSRIVGNPQIVLRVEFPDSQPSNLQGLHWRGRSYDRFDGIRWTRSRDLPPSSAPASWYQERWDGRVIAQRIYGAALDTRVLFSLHPTLRIESENGIQPLFDNAGDFVYWGAGAPAYRSISREGSPPPDRLRAASDGFRPSRRHYLQLPDLDPRVAALADSLTAGWTSRYDKTTAIQSWLRGLTYTLDLPATAREATLAHFLFERKAGHCEYFSTAMVVLLRAAGIEARNVNGFLGGEWSAFGNYLAVTQNQAHSWVEVWFPRIGWVTFDPTPTGGSGERLASWYWPGRFLFDGLQHRWNKWVLDYDADSQLGIIQRWAEFLEPVAETGPTDEPDGRSGPWAAWLMVLAAAAALWGAIRILRERDSIPTHTKLYLALRRTGMSAGLEIGPGTTPAGLVSRVVERTPAAGVDASRLVALYTAARFGRRPLDPTDIEEMRSALRRIGQALRNVRSAG